MRLLYNRVPSLATKDFRRSNATDSVAMINYQQRFTRRPFVAFPRGVNDNDEPSWRYRSADSNAFAGVRERIVKPVAKWGYYDLRV